MFRIIQCFLLTFLVSCGGVQFINQVNRDQYYSRDFLNTVQQINALFKVENYSKVREVLASMDDTLLRPSEIAMKRNFEGQSYLLEGNNEKALLNFELALSIEFKDNTLRSQILINSANANYNLGLYQQSLEILSDVRLELVPKSNRIKFFELSYEISSYLNEPDLAFESLTGIIKHLEYSENISTNNFFNEYQRKLSSRSIKDQLFLVEQLLETKSYAVALIARRWIEKFNSLGRLEEAKYLLSKLSELAEDDANIKRVTDNITQKIGAISKVDTKAIGIILPLSGEFNRFGLAALKGIQSEFQKTFAKHGYRLYVRDSRSSAIVSKAMVRELVQKHHVAVIIGGIQSALATQGYLEAKKNNVVFISLAKVFLSAAQKNHLLLEVPGSVESEIQALVQAVVSNESVGRRGAIVYPDNSNGRIYLDHFWQQSKLNEIKVVDAVKFDPKKNDLRLPIKKLLGLHYTRMRKEELETLDKLYALEKTTIRRVQKLRPQIDFDWVFIPSSPLKAAQIVPGFKYYDAFGVPIYGTANWAARSIRKLSKKIDGLHFTYGELFNSGKKLNVSEFKRIYGHLPKPPEERGLTSMLVLKEFLRGGRHENREDLIRHIQSKGRIEVANIAWSLKDSIWIREMAITHYYKGRLKAGNWRVEVEEEKSSPE